MLFGAMRSYGVPTARSLQLTQNDRDHVIFSYAKDNANSVNWMTNWPPPQHYYVVPTGNAGAVLSSMKTWIKPTRPILNSLSRTSSYGTWP